MFHHNISENTEILLSLLLEGDAVVEGQNSLNRIFVPSNRRSFNVPLCFPSPTYQNTTLLGPIAGGFFFLTENKP